MGLKIGTEVRLGYIYYDKRGGYTKNHVGIVIGELGESTSVVRMNDNLQTTLSVCDIDLEIIKMPSDDADNIKDDGINNSDDILLCYEKLMEQEYESRRMPTFADTLQQSKEIIIDEMKLKQIWRQIEIDSQPLEINLNDNSKLPPEQKSSICTVKAGIQDVKKSYSKKVDKSHRYLSNVQINYNFGYNNDIDIFKDKPDMIGELNEQLRSGNISLNRFISSYVKLSHYD